MTESERERAAESLRRDPALRGPPPGTRGPCPGLSAVSAFTEGGDPPDCPGEEGSGSPGGHG